jgi:hypothetical protein
MAEVDREEVAETLRRLIEESISDPRPDISARDVFKRLRAEHERNARYRAS